MSRDQLRLSQAGLGSSFGWCVKWAGGQFGHVEGARSEAPKLALEQPEVWGPGSFGSWCILRGNIFLL